MDDDDGPASAAAVGAAAGAGHGAGAGADEEMGVALGSPAHDAVEFARASHGAASATGADADAARTSAAPYTPPTTSGGSGGGAPSPSTNPFGSSSPAGARPFSAGSGAAHAGAGFGAYSGAGPGGANAAPDRGLISPSMSVPHSVSSDSAEFAAAARFASPGSGSGSGAGAGGFAGFASPGTFGAGSPGAFAFGSASSGPQSPASARTGSAGSAAPAGAASAASPAAAASPHQPWASSPLVPPAARPGSAHRSPLGAGAGLADRAPATGSAPGATTAAAPAPGPAAGMSSYVWPAGAQQQQQPQATSAGDIPILRPGGEAAPAASGGPSSTLAPGPVASSSPSSSQRGSVSSSTATQKGGDDAAFSRAGPNSALAAAAAAATRGLDRDARRRSSGGSSSAQHAAAAAAVAARIARRPSTANSSSGSARSGLAQHAAAATGAPSSDGLASAPAVATPRPVDVLTPTSEGSSHPPSYFSGRASGTAGSGVSSTLATPITPTSAASASSAAQPQPPSSARERALPPGTAPGAIAGASAAQGPSSAAPSTATASAAAARPPSGGRVRPSTTAGAMSRPFRTYAASAGSSPASSPRLHAAAAPALSPIQLRELHQLEDERLQRMSTPRLVDDLQLALEQDLEQQADRVRAASIATGGPIEFYTARQHQSYLESVRGEIAQRIYPVDPIAAAEYLSSGQLPRTERGTDAAALAVTAAASAYGLESAPAAAQFVLYDPSAPPFRTTSQPEDSADAPSSAPTPRQPVQELPEQGLGIAGSSSAGAPPLEYGRVITGQGGALRAEPDDYADEEDKAPSPYDERDLDYELHRAGEATMQSLELQRQHRLVAEPLPPISQLTHIRDDPAASPPLSDPRSPFHSPSATSATALSRSGQSASTQGQGSVRSSASSTTVLDEQGRLVKRVPVPRPRLQSKVYGLTSDLRARVQRRVPVQAEYIERGDWRAEEESIKSFTPSFSVELAAKSFDMRDRAVFIGRAPLIRGVVRIPASPKKWLAVKLVAHCTSPASNADGAALGPANQKPTKHGERQIFETVDVYDTAKLQVLAKPPPIDPRTGQPDPNWVARDRERDFIIEVPFDINLPVGISSVYKDGQLVHQPTPLPPSYEASDDTFAEQPWKGEGRERSKNAAVREALTKGFTKSQRLGVWYEVRFDLYDGAAPADNQVPKLSKSKEKKRDKGDSMKIPFIFLGEPGNLRTGPQMLPPIVSPRFLLEPGYKLCSGWTCHIGKTKWAKANWSVFKRELRVELHLPKPAYFDIPSVIPFLLVLRPEDGKQLPSMDDDEVRDILSSPNMSVSQLFGQSVSDLRTLNEKDEDASIEQQLAMQDINNKAAALMEKYESSLKPKKVGSWMKSKFGKGKEKEKEQALGATASRSDLASPSEDKLKLSPTSTLRSFRRPGTTETSRTGAASTVSSMGYSQAPSALTVTTVHDICSYIKVTLVQVLHVDEGNVNSAPTIRRRVLAHADLEEVDVSTMFMRDEDFNNPNPRPFHPKVQEAIDRAKKEGWRVVQGMVRVGPEHSPGFKCQGLALRHALKVDLLPFTKVLKKAVKETANLADLPEAPSQSSFGSFKQRNGSSGTLPSTIAGDQSSSPAFSSTNLISSRPSSATKTPPSPKRGAFGTYGSMIVRHGSRAHPPSAGSGSSRGAGTDVQSISAESPPPTGAERTPVVQESPTSTLRSYSGMNPSPKAAPGPASAAMQSRMGRMLPPRTPASLAGPMNPRSRLGTAISSASGVSGFSSANRSDISGTWSTFSMDPLNMNKEFSLHKTYGVIWVDVRLQRGKINQNVYGAEI